MAIFGTTDELNRQGKVTAPDIVRQGEGAGVMRALGYNPTSGKETGWGKFLHAIPGMSTTTNMLAGGVSKGTDINPVIREGRDEAIAYDLNKAALGLDVFKLAATAGVGGAAAQFSNPLAQTLMGGATNLLHEGARMMSNGNTVSESDLMDAKNSMSPGDYRRYVRSMGYSDDNMALGKYNRTMDTIGSLGGVANSLTRTIQGGMAYNDELNQASSGLYKSTDEPFSYL